MSWYAEDPAWVLPFQRDARRKYGASIVSELDDQVLRYRFDGLEVPGRHADISLEIYFYRRPRYATYGLAPEDYPRVFADLGLASPHRMPDDSLCLYYPGDSPERRWEANLGLLPLIDLTRDHIFKETYWRATGASKRGVWLGDEAPHGYHGGST